MSKKDISQTSLVIHSDASIQEAMGAITDNQRGAVVVVNEAGVFAGVVSDGDIRRGMLRGATALTPVEKVLNTNAMVITETEAHAGKGEELLKEKSDITLLPVLGKGNIVVDVLIRNPEQRKDL